MRMPGDNTLVDTDRRIVRDWRNFFLKLEPPSNLSATDVATLKTFIEAAEEILAEPEPVEFPEFTPYEVDLQSFTASGVWVKPDFGTWALIRVWGTGGSGASSTGAAANTSGGGGGVCAERWVLLSLMGDSEIYTAGVPGAGVSGNNSGNDGTTSTFGSWLSAPGGGGGARSASGSGANGGFGAGVLPTSTGVEATAGTTGHKDANHRGGGAPGGGVTSGDVAAIGGDAFSGGAGGGAASGGDDAVGGTSVEGGNGGAGSDGSDGVTGSSRGGGGGASRGGTSGAGGAAYCEVTVF